MRTFRIRASFIILTLLLGACTFTLPVASTPTPIYTPTPTPLPTPAAVSAVVGLPQGTDGYAWWNDTVFYEIFVRSFYDSNGDGIGDFNGITQKLDYLQNLGVTGLWLMPIFPSPSYHGYDVTNYEAVNPEYGTLADFKRLVDEAHKRGMRVILDMVLNHTSDLHPWFQAAQAKNSPYRNFYIWSDTNPGYAGPWGEQVWFPSSSGYFYAIFAENMPDLNYRNPDVTAQMEAAVRFWLQQTGIDGFRLDAVRHLIEDGPTQVNTPETHAWLQGFRTFYKGVDPNAVTVGELAGEDAGVMASYLKGDQLDLAFDFDLAAALVKTADTGQVSNLTSQLMISYKLIPALQFAPFLTNHDQDRLMSQLGNDPNKVKLAAALLLTGPGVPFLYYGEEIGLEGTGQDPLKRAPMQWTADPTGGFSTHVPWEPLGPESQTYNVAAETGDPNSILNAYRALIQVRNQHAALRVGDVNPVSSGNPGLDASLRISKNEALLVLINLTAAPITDYSLSLGKSGLAQGTYALLTVMGTEPAANLPVSTVGDFSGARPVSSIPPYGTLIFQLNKLVSGK